MQGVRNGQEVTVLLLKRAFDKQFTLSWCFLLVKSAVLTNKP